MEIKDMQAFFAVVEEGNISHAAMRLAVAQPALSRQMKRLEEELGAALFERGSRRIRLTEVGELLYSRVSRILGMVDGTIREIREVGLGVSGIIRIGTITSSGALVLPRAISEFHRRFPDVSFQIWEGEGTRVLELLDSRTVDIAVTRTEVDEETYSSIVIANEPLVILMNKNSPAGESDDEIKISELSGKPMIVPFRWKAIFESHCKKSGFIPKIICESDSIVQDVLNVREEIGMALLPLSAKSLTTAGDELMVKKLVDPGITTHTVVSWTRGRKLSVCADYFIKMFKELYPDNSG